jgi:hypothetical protein
MTSSDKPEKPAWAPVPPSKSEQNTGQTAAQATRETELFARLSQVKQYPIAPDEPQPAQPSKTRLYRALSLAEARRRRIPTGNDLDHLAASEKAFQGLSKLRRADSSGASAETDRCCTELSAADCFAELYILRSGRARVLLAGLVSA